MCRKGQTVMFNGKEYRLTWKGRLYASWLLFVDRIKKMARNLQAESGGETDIVNSRMPPENAPGRRK